MTQVFVKTLQKSTGEIKIRLEKNNQLKIS